MRRRTAGLVALAWSMAATLQASDAQTTTAAPPPLSEGRGFVQQDGAGLYGAICQGCHMADGKGAIGAGAYPALAANAKLASAPYVVVTVLAGRRGMPGFGEALGDAQVAAVASYVRQRFGPDATTAVTAADVQALRSVASNPR